MWSLYSVREPIWAYLYDRTVARLPTVGATCSVGRFTEPKIEPEIVFHFRSAPQLGIDLVGLLKCIDWITHGFEIVQSHFPGWRFQAPDTVADSALHGTLLLGEPVPIERLKPDPIAALESFSLTLSCNGQVKGVGKGSNVLGSPLAALAHLLAVLSKQPECVPMRDDEIVTTGTITTAQTIRPGERWQTILQGIPLSGLVLEVVP